jgi:hypothetical protein
MQAPDLLGAAVRPRTLASRPLGTLCETRINLRSTSAGSPASGEEANGPLSRGIFGSELVSGWRDSGDYVQRRCIRLAKTGFCAHLLWHICQWLPCERRVEALGRCHIAVARAAQAEGFSHRSRYDVVRERQAAALTDDHTSNGLQ